MDERIALARRAAPTLVGLSIDEARRLIASAVGIYLRELGPDDGYEQNLAFGRITVVVADHEVIKAWAG